MLRSNFYTIQGPLLKLSGNRHEFAGTRGPFIASNKIFVIRNEAFEPYLAHGVNCAAQIGVELKLNFSGYDDSFSYFVIPEDVDQVVIWMNWDRIPPSQLNRFFQSNARLLEYSTDARFYIVLPSKYGVHELCSFQSKLESIGWPAERIIAGVNSQSNENSRIKLGYTREELDSISTKIGIQVSSNLTQIRIRALILDLDNTLYRGVFGEDSTDEVFPESEHLKLHVQLKRLKESGVLLCLATKNNLNDIESIFQSKLTSVLERADFAIISGGWESKAKSIGDILNDLNFGENFVAFIDDNKRELYEVGKTFPNLMCIDGKNTENLLKVLDTCLTFETSQNGKVSESRNNDIKASRLRQNLATSIESSDSLLIDLNTRLKAQRVVNSEDFHRAMELFRKTNQFNLTLGRYTCDVREIESVKNELVVASIKDDISDSGVIAAIKVSYLDEIIELQEFTISCRALGRNVEKYLLRAMLSKVDIEFEERQIVVRFKLGPKNQPAFDFVQQYFAKDRELYILNTNILMSETSEWYPLLCESN